jgi:hypothetical protein
MPAAAPALLGQGAAGGRNGPDCGEAGPGRSGREQNRRAEPREQFRIS